MSSEISPVIQSFQSKLRLFQSLKTHGDQKLSRSCNLVTGSFSSRRIHLVSRSFLRYLANSGSGCGYCQPQDNVLPMLLRSLRRHQRELGNGKCQWDNCVTTRSSTRPSDSEKLGHKSPRRNLNSHTPATCSRDCSKSCISSVFSSWIQIQFYFLNTITQFFKKM